MQKRFLGFNLSRRIVVLVGFGLGVVLAIASLLAIWTIEESTEAAYLERVRVARALADSVDESLSHTALVLESDLNEFKFNPDHRLSERQQQLLAELDPPIGHFASLSVSDDAGNTVWTQPNESNGVKPNNVGDSLLQPIPNSKTVDVTACSDKTHSTHLCLAMTLHGSDERSTGTLFAELSPTAIIQSFADENEGDSQLRVEFIKTSAILDELDDRSPNEHASLLAPLIDSRVAGYRVHETSNGNEHVVAYAPMSFDPSWGVTVEEPVDSILAVPAQLKTRLIIFGALMLGLAMVVAWFDVIKVVRPLGQLTLAAERFAADDLDEPIHLERNDEIGILARAFETMRQRLRASRAEIEDWNQELERRVARRTAEVEDRNRELARLNSIAETVSNSLDEGTVLNATLHRMLAITGVDAGCFAVPNGDLTLRFVASSPAPLGDSTSTDSPGKSLCREALETNKIVVGCPAQLLERFPQLSSWVAVPLPAREEVQGVMLLGARHPDHFDQHSLATLSAIGQQVGLALSNARLYEGLRARERERAALLQRIMGAQEDERRRLAQELHDETSQALASLRLGLERLSGLEGSIPENVRELAQELQSIAEFTLSEVHRLAVELRPSILDDVGLVAAVERYLQESPASRGLAVDFVAVGMEKLRLIPAAETAIYRIVQSALTNVVQHAHAQRVSVLLERRQSALIVIIEDDGVGFDPIAVRKGPLESRLGLVGMEERASLLGAVLTFETSPGSSTTLFLEVPLDPNSQQEVAHD